MKTIKLRVSIENSLWHREGCVVMNKIILAGRLTRNPEIRYSQGENAIPIARYSLAVDKKTKRQDGKTADFFNIVAFDRHADFAEKYLCKGKKVLVAGHVNTGSYIKDGTDVKVPFFEVIVEEHEFAESKKEEVGNIVPDNVFMQIPDDLEGLPFNM